MRFVLSKNTIRLAAMLAVHLFVFGSVAVARADLNTYQPTDDLCRSKITAFACAIGAKQESLAFEDVTTYSGLNGEPVADCVSFRISGMPAFAFVSREGTLLEFRIATCPHAVALASCEQVARGCIGRERDLGQPQFVYAGTSMYLVRFPILVSGQEVAKLTVDMRSGQVVDGQIQSRPSVSDAKPSSDKRPVVSSEMARSPLVHQKMLENVPHFAYYISDGATSAASVIAYWERKLGINLRKPSMRNPDQLESDEEFITEFTTGGCTCNLLGTLEQFAGTRGYELKTTYRKTSSSVPDSAATFSHYQSQIDAGSPALVVFSAGGMRHTMPAVGYIDGPMGDYVIAVDQTPPGQPMESSEVGYYLWDGDVETTELTFVKQPQKKT